MQPRMLDVHVVKRNHLHDSTNNVTLYEIVTPKSPITYLSPSLHLHFHCRLNLQLGATASMLHFKIVVVC